MFPSRRVPGRRAPARPVSASDTTPVEEVDPATRPVRSGGAGRSPAADGGDDGMGGVHGFEDLRVTDQLDGLEELRGPVATGVDEQFTEDLSGWQDHATTQFGTAQLGGAAGTPQPPWETPEPQGFVRRAAGGVTAVIGGTARRVQAASRADGAAESGLSQLLWVNALHMAGDAMIAVSLAGTLFFAAASGAQRGNVALYLLVTMAPFAVLAPVIGPLLDRLQRGRRWAMAACLLGRALLAVVMAANFHDFWLYPAALGTLVLSKAASVLRAAVVPRVLPPGLPLTSANSRLSVFGLATAGVAGGVAGGVAKVLGFGPELWLTAAVFVVGAVLAVRLPAHVDVPNGEQPATVLLTGPVDTPAKRRRAVSPHVTTALRANAALRFLGGFLTIFSAFLVEATVPGGWRATLALGGIAAAAGIGSFAGTAAGSRLRTASPDRIVLVSAGSAAAVTVLAAIFFGLWLAAVVAFVSAVANALAKVALDAIIQREVREAQRASAFARSETFLQLAWVVGGAFGILLPTVGWIGFTVAAGLLTLAVALVLWGRARNQAAGYESPGPDVVPPDAPWS